MLEMNRKRFFVLLLIYSSFTNFSNAGKLSEKSHQIFRVELKSHEILISDFIKELIINYEYHCNFLLHLEESGQHIKHRLLTGISEETASKIIVDHSSLSTACEDWLKLFYDTRSSHSCSLHIILFEDPISLGPFLKNCTPMRTFDKVVYLVPEKEASSVPRFWTNAGLERAGNILFAFYNETSSSIQLQTTCFFCSHQTARLRHIHEYKKNYSIVTKTLFPEQFSDFKGHKFYVAYANYVPFFWCKEPVYYRYRAQRRCLTAKGLEYNMLKILSTKLNVTFELIDYSTGGQTINKSMGSWNRMLFAVHKKLVDMAVGGISVTSQRRQLTDFTKRFNYEPSVFVFKRSFDHRLLNVWLPFSMRVWLWIGTSIIVGACVITIAEETEFLEGIAICVYFLLGQNVKRCPLSRYSTYIFLIVWNIYGILTATFYNSKLVSAMIDPDMVHEPTTLNEAIQMDYNFHMSVQNGALESLIFANNSTLYETVKNRLTLVNNHTAGMELLLDDNLNAYLSERSAVEYHKKNEKTKSDFKFLKSGDEEFFPTGHAWPLIKGAPYHKRFDRVIGKILQSGIRQRWISEFLQDNLIIHVPLNKKGGQNGEKHEYFPLNIKNMRGTFLVLGLGMLLGFVELVAELIRHRLKHGNENRIQPKKPLNKYTF